MSKDKVWLITGTSSGLGRAIAEEVLSQGFKVIATARKTETLTDLVEKYPETARAFKLDVTNQRSVQAAIANAFKEFGRIDVVVNNAGNGIVGAIEEVTDEEAKHQFDTNVFGLLNVTREVLPILREQKSGHIVNISSLAGFSAFPSFGIYSATKFAVEGISEALAGEVASHQIKTTVIDLGAFHTGITTRAFIGSNRLPEAYPTTDGLLNALPQFDSPASGDPKKAAKIIFEAVESENPPFRLPIGQDSFDAIDAKIENVQKENSIWRERATQTKFDVAVTA
ncbi:MAG: SDR family oxidoreductase [Pyrinomonadaceae bacterium]|nr:SDR family oxidoreductase [Pyrinomonadaceae bacterium]